MVALCNIGLRMMISGLFGSLRHSLLVCSCCLIFAPQTKRPRPPGEEALYKYPTRRRVTTPLAGSGGVETPALRCPRPFGPSLHLPFLYPPSNPAPLPCHPTLALALWQERMNHEGRRSHRRLVRRPHHRPRRAPPSPRAAIAAALATADGHPMLPDAS